MNEELGQVSRCYSLTYQREVKQPPERLWRALTDQREASIWMGHPASIDLRVGGGYKVDFSRTGGLDIDGVIVALAPGKLLRYAWGTAIVDWTIEPTERGSKYVLMLSALTPQMVPADAFAAGWHCQLGDLERYLGTGAASTDEEGRALWDSLRPVYAPRAVAALEVAS